MITLIRNTASKKLGNLLLLAMCSVFVQFSQANELKITPVQLYNLGVKIDQINQIDSIPELVTQVTVTIPSGQDYIVSTSLSGLIHQLKVSVGDRVKKDQIVALINSPDILALQQQFLNALNEKNIAHANYKRDEKLFNEGVISQKRFQLSKNQYTSAFTARNQHTQMLQLAGMSEKEIKHLALNKKLQSQIAIYSPIDGTVLERKVTTGENLNTLTALYRIANLEKVWLEAYLPHHSISHIQLGDPISLSSTKAKASIILIGQSVNPDDQTVLVRAEINNQPPHLRIGQVVDAKIIQRSKQPTFKVPQAAVIEMEQRPYLFIRNEHGFSLAEIKIITHQEKQYVITSTTHLPESTQIAVRGSKALKAIWQELNPTTLSDK